MLAPAFAPFANPEAFSNNKLALALLEAGHQVDVISRKMRGTSDYDYGSEWEAPWLSLKDLVREIEVTKTGALGRASDFVRCTLATGHPVQGVRWAWRASELGRRLHEEKPYDAILSRAFPLSAHLAGLLMARSSRLPWFANWNDPWEFMRSSRTIGGLRSNIGLFEARLVREIAVHATFHICPSRRLARAMNYYLKCCPEKWVVIPHAPVTFEPNLGPLNNTFTIGYFGRLTEAHGALTLVQALSLFRGTSEEGPRELRVRLVGLIDQRVVRAVKEAGLEGVVTIEPPIPFMDCFREMRACDALLVMDPPGTGGTLLQSKVSDYLTVGRPILAVAQADSELAEVIIEGRCGLVIDPDNPVQLCAALRALSLERSGTKVQSPKCDTSRMNGTGWGVDASTIAKAYEDLVIAARSNLSPVSRDLRVSRGIKGASAS